MSKVEDAIEKAKEMLPNITPTPPGLKAQSSVHDLKSRLEWGEPGLTILDVRPRDVYNQGHIMGAMEFPIDKLVDLAKNNFESNRDIYVYGASDQETAEAANLLRQAGFNSVSELKGGLDAWKAVAGSTEGVDESLADPGKNAYNVVDNVKNHFERQEIDFEKP
ncbi:rhodanese-like domain-containing protein [Cyanobacteria bacterium FACHB-DQ100]|uniref:rhodanese-like domain-containing protein n=1 Tax=unclassified Leptolyngbya TaxID=2650499 RepID=UPI0016818B0B|nr:rhodanese-like domain-containing protein [Leptolyngbya sp. FACHB-17]MBD1823782.1 rhodanese-like domain-containing protein [Cyanobacteria bacterium FACHB-DQ100]MBD2079809.1 rhodanese-like domain-containing protein [Leptolyngbya sp. FACHB-17]